MDRVRNNNMRKRAQVGQLGNKAIYIIMKCFGRMQKEESVFIGRRMLELIDKEQRRKPKKRIMDFV